MDITLEKIDIIRDRTGLSYKQAKEALERNNGDLVETLIELEEDKSTWKEEIHVKGTELVSKIREIINKGNVTRIKIKQNDQIILDIPITAGAIGALIVPQIAALGVIAALVTKCSIEIERSKDPQEGMDPIVQDEIIDNP